MTRYSAGSRRLALGAAAICLATSFFAAAHAAIASPPAPAPLVYDLAELWRLDPDDDDLVFGIIAGAVFDPDGRCYLLDTQLAYIYVIDDRGDLVATLGRPGDGPGEFRFPSSLSWWDEQTLAVAHGMAGRLELIDVRGEPAGAVHFSRDGQRRPVPVSRAAPFAGGLVIEVMNTTSDGRTVWMQTDLLLCARDGAERAVLRSFKQTMDVGRYVFDERQDVAPWSGWTVLPDGPLVLRCGHEGYTLAAIDGAGSEATFAQRPYASMKREPALIEAIRQELQAVVGANLADATVIVADTHPDITGLFAGPDGLLWVRTSRRDAGSSGTYLVAADVHARDGSWLHVAEMRTSPAAGTGEVVACSDSRVIARHRIDRAGRVLGAFEPGGDVRLVYVCYRATRRG